MTIERIINGNLEKIELTRKEMEKAFEIVRIRDLEQYFEQNLEVLHPNIVTHPYLYDRLLSDYLSEWRKIDSTDEEEVFNKVMEKNKQLIKSFKKMRE